MEACGSEELLNLSLRVTQAGLLVAAHQTPQALSWSRERVCGLQQPPETREEKALVLCSLQSLPGKSCLLPWGRGGQTGLRDSATGLGTGEGSSLPFHSYFPLETWCPQGWVQCHGAPSRSPPLGHFLFSALASEKDLFREK